MLQIDLELLNEKTLEKGWNQAELSRQSGLSPSLVSGISNGNPATPRSVEAIAGALGISVHELLEQDRQSVEANIEVTPHRVSGKWKGSYTLFLSLVGSLSSENGAPLEDETINIEGEICATQKEGQANMSFTSRRAKKLIHLPHVNLKIIDGSKILMEYDREGDKDVLRLGAGIIELNSFGDRLNGFYTTCDPAFDGKLIPAFLDLKKLPAPA